MHGRPPPAGAFGDDGAWIDYAGPPGTVPAVPWVSVVEREPDGARARRARSWSSALTATVLQDVHETPAPGEGLMSGPEIQANAIATVLRGAPLRSAAPAVDPALIVLLAAVVPLLALRWALRALAAAPLVILLYLAAAQLAFEQDRVIGVLPPLVALAVAASGTAVALLATEVRRRRLLRHTLARFAPDAIVDEVLERAEAGGGRLPPVELDATVMFCDLRGFTGFAERHPVSVVIETLDRYLDEVADTVMAHGGTVVAYLGDGAMAVFGAPVAQDDHADRALAAARELVGRRVERLNGWLGERGIDDRFTLGAGLHSGPVMSGTVGSERRIEYAAVGDTTNVAARLQAQTRERGVALLLSESTHGRLTTPGRPARPRRGAAPRPQRAARNLDARVMYGVAAPHPARGRLAGDPGAARTALRPRPPSSRSASPSSGPAARSSSTATAAAASGSCRSRASRDRRARPGRRPADHLGRRGLADARRARARRRRVDGLRRRALTQRHVLQRRARARPAAARGRATSCASGARWWRSGRPSSRARRRPRWRPTAPAAALTDTQRRVLVALCRPLRDSAYATPATNQTIAGEVFLGVDAVKVHLRALYRKLGIGDLPQNEKRARLVELAFHHGLVDDRDLGG